MSLPFPKKNIPNKIEPCPILDASTEVRFDTNIPAGAIFGILYNAFQKEYTDYITLPIQQIPEDIRAVDETIKYQPHYRINKGNFTLLIGPQVLSIGCINSYPGWGEYKNIIVDALTKLQESGIPTKITRLGLRYMNFFENTDVFQKLDSAVFSKNSLLVERNSYVRTEFSDNDVTHILQIASGAKFTKGNEEKHGSMIDIDVSQTIHLDNFFEHAEEKISHLHDIEKQIFFGLLSDDYLTKFKQS